MDRIRRHVTFANVTSAVALFVALGGGTAAALNGSNTVQSDDLGPGAQVKASDVADNAVNAADVTNESLTGTDIKNRSGVQTCKPSTTRYGAICVDATHLKLGWDDAIAYCTDLGLRLPTLSEAVVLAKRFDVPDVGDTEPFWTQERSFQNNTTVYLHVRDNGSFNFALAGGSDAAICVTDPSA